MRRLSLWTRNPEAELLPLSLAKRFLAITRKGAWPGLLAFLPGHHRPALLPGMTLRLELDGWPRGLPRGHG